MNKHVVFVLFSANLLLAGVAVAVTKDATPGADSRRLQKATFAGGCFWCMEEALDKVEGVVSTTSGYTGGMKKNPAYEDVSAGEYHQNFYEKNPIRYRLYKFNCGRAQRLQELWGK